MGKFDTMRLNLRVPREESLLWGATQAKQGADGRVAAVIVTYNRILLLCDSASTAPR